MSEVTKYRTLIRIEKIGKAVVYVVIPGIDPTKQWMINKRNIPFKIKEGQHLFALTNLNAKHEPELGIMDWEQP